MPNTGEDFETAKTRIVSSLGPSPTDIEAHTAAVLDAYASGNCPDQFEGQCYLLEITHWAIGVQALPLFGSTADYATVVAGDYEPEWADWAIPRPSLSDRDILVALYNATDGAKWTNNANWLTEAPIGEWRGVSTDANGRVTELYLTKNWLSGDIPAELGGLDNLTGLYLGGN